MKKPLSDSNRLWAGKAVGATLGFLGGGPFGLVVGVIAGHLFDRVLEKARQEPPGPLAAEHISALFRIMGHLAKADGRICEAEIDAAGKVMTSLKLSSDRRTMAQKLFSEGKSSSYRLDADLSHLERTLPAVQQDDFMRMLVAVARADGRIRRAERKVLKQLASAFGIPPLRYYWLLYKDQDGVQVGTASAAQKGRSGAQKASVQPENKMSREVRRAFNVLGLAPDATEAEIKQTFRRLMSEYHPDKIQARGVSASELERAKAKAQEIQTAYALIRKHLRAHR